MDKQTLAKLEQAVEPYRRAGFFITSQSEGSITLVRPKDKFSYLLFITLLLIWPLALIYLISYNNQKQKWVCVRITSQGEIEEIGYTTSLVERDRRRDRMANSIFLVILIVILVIGIIVILNLAGVLK